MQTNPQNEEVEDSDVLDDIVDEILGETDPEQDTQKAEEEVTDEASNEDEQEEVDEEPEYFELKHNGKPVKLKLEEVTELAQKGFDYTQKTQEVAEMRRQVEQYAQFIQQQSAMQQELQKEYAQISALDMQLQQYKQVDWAAYTDQDPVEATKAWQRYQILQQQKGELASQVNQRQSQMQSEIARHKEQKLAESAAELEREFGKAWTPETRQALKLNTKEYGFTDEEIATIEDPRVVKVLMDAYKYRQLQSQKVAVTKKVSDAPKLAKPGSKPVQVDTQKKQLQKMLKSSSSRTTREKAAMALLDDFV